MHKTSTRPPTSLSETEPQGYDDLMEFRDCFAKPPCETDDAVQLLRSAAAAHEANDFERASHLLIDADNSIILSWRMHVMAGYRPEIHGPGPQMTTLPLEAKDRDPRRMPLAGLQNELLARDGYRCRFCGMKLMRLKVCKRIFSTYPKATKATASQWERHALIGGMVVQFDHIVPWSRGGRTTIENMVITCPPCNYGRGSWTLEESRLTDPRNREVEPTDWDGLINAFRT